MDPYREQGDFAGPPCPRCAEPGTRLVPLSLADREIFECAKGHGFWMPAVVFNDVLVETELQQEALAVDRGQAPKRAEIAAPLACPRCHEVMRRAELGSSSGILVDSCRRHGIWLDRSELAAVAAFARARLPPQAADETMESGEYVTMPSAAELRNLLAPPGRSGALQGLMRAFLRIWGPKA